MLAGIPRKELGTEVDNLRGKSFEIIAALDVLISGVERSFNSWQSVAESIFDSVSLAAWKPDNRTATQ